MEETQGLRDYSDHTPSRSIDPVCGREVYQETAFGKTGYWGQMYYFCSDECQKTFEEDPARFAGRQR